MTLRTAALTDIGLLRSENEDSLLCDDALQLYAVADGLGGLPAGAEASRATVTGLAAWFRQNQPATDADYARCLDVVNREVFFLGLKLSPQDGIGSTLTAMHLREGQMRVLHVGDSFLFRLRAGRCEALTEEHNVGNELRHKAARGEKVPPFHGNPHALTRCIGLAGPAGGDISSHPLAAGDRYLLCSDGISGVISLAELGRMMTETSDPKMLCRRLVAGANQRGGRDNATAVAVYVD